ncbi:MAG TPA: signal peptide peptidase SppA [Sedimentisphaerales bacterium]|nr:signal peptide peptidase SppA [Sedimentisphaerales bacterium]
MDITDFSNGQIWSILPEKLEILLRKFQDFREYKEGGVEAASLFRMADAPEKPYEITDGVAIIPVNGPIVKRSSFFSFLFGGASVTAITAALQQAAADREAAAIVLAIDSPGGTIYGIESLAGLIRKIDAEKPVVAFGAGDMASAAYWLASAARTIVAENTAQVGSIGVLILHYDYSENDRQYGVKRTYIAAGKYKALGNDAEPLSREARDMFEEKLNHYYSLFVDTIARNRGVDAATVLEKMADGRIFIGRQALDAGLIDKIGDIGAAIDAALALTADKGNRKTNYAGGNPPGKEPIMEGKNQVASITTIEQLAAAYPALVASIREDGAKSVDIAAFKTEAARLEKERVVGLAAVSFGEEAGQKFRAIVESGLNVEQFRAVRQAMPEARVADDAEAKKREEMLAAIKASGADNPGSGSQPVPHGSKDFMAVVEEYIAMHKCSRTDAMKKVIADHPALHKEYLKKANVHLVK